MLPEPELDIHAPRVLLISVHPIYAKRFFDQTKKVELRRTRPRLRMGDFVLFYVSSPEQIIGGGGLVDQVLELPPEFLWREVESKAGISKEGFDDYFRGAATGYGILFERIWSFEPSISRAEIICKWPGFKPPQLYRYLSGPEIRRLGVRVHDSSLSKIG